MKAWRYGKENDRMYEKDATKDRNGGGMGWRGRREARRKVKKGSRGKEVEEA